MRIWACRRSPVGPSKEQIEQIQKPLAEQLSTKDAQITALSAQNADPTSSCSKETRRPGRSATGGGRGGRFNRQGAAEGDARLQQALDLLKENKIADAAQLLKTFAEDKTVQAEQATSQAEKDRKEAAIAYRNLGAIAGLRDPRQALEAYGKALALDPDDLGSLLWAGLIQIDHGDLNEAQARLERALSLAKTGDHFYRYWVTFGLGDIEVRRGDLAGALKSYRDALAIIEGVKKSHSGNADLQHDLSASYERIGDVQVAQGDLAGALNSYRDGFAAMDHLAKSDPGNAGWQRDLAVSYEGVGNIQMAQGDLAGALTSYRESLAIIGRLAKADPGNAELQRAVSVFYEKVGIAQARQGDPADALKSFSDSLAIRDRLAKADPGNAGWQRDLSVSYSMLARRVPNVQRDGKGPRGFDVRRTIIVKLLMQHRIGRNGNRT